MAEILSRSEMDSLLAALDCGPVLNRDDRRATNYVPAPHAPLGAESIRSIRKLHECFAGEFSASLSGLLRRPVDVNLISVEQLAYGEYAAAVEHPACLYRIQADPLAGSWLLEWSASIAFPIVDRLLGGRRGASQPTPRRSLTEIERHVLARATERAAVALQTAWTPVYQLNPRTTRDESLHPEFSIFAPDVEVVLVSFGVSMSDVTGVLNLCLPYPTLAPLEVRLAAEATDVEQGDDWERGDDRKQIVRLQRIAPRTAVELVVQLASTRLTADEVANLAVGDVIVTDCGQGDPLSVRIDGDCRFTGHAGSAKGRKAVRIGSGLNSASEPHAPSPPIAAEGRPPATSRSDFTERD